jgi:uncharacterized protein (DUF983 family)
MVSSFGGHEDRFHVLVVVMCDRKGDTKTVEGFTKSVSKCAICGMDVVFSQGVLAKTVNVAAEMGGLASFHPVA